MFSLHANRSNLARPPRPLLVRVAALLLAAVLADAAFAQAAKEASQIGASGHKVPRYVSLKADRVHLRQGPGKDYPTTWSFQRTGLPVEVIREVEVWREVRDAGGAVGWVHGSLLSSRRTALVLPWEITDGHASKASALLREDDSESSRAIAQVEAGTLASIITCKTGWCRVSVDQFRGYIEQKKLWGTYPDERIK